MGGLHTPQTTSKGGQLGKIDAPLNRMLESVEWGEYRLGNLFEILSSKKRFDANKVVIGDKGHPYVVRTSQNNGIRGLIEADEAFLNDANTISFGQDTATMYYQPIPYFTGDKIKVLRPKFAHFNKRNAQFFISCLQKPFMSFAWGASSFNVKTLEKQSLLLPTRNGKIDYEFIERFIAELNAARLAELNAYLSITGLKDYRLTPEEEQAIKDFETGKAEWGEFRFENVFNHIKQGRRLKKDDQKKGTIPFIMAGVSNTGVVNYISNPIATFPANSITIDIFGNTFYRSYAFGAGDDTGVYWNDKEAYSKGLMLFFTTAMSRALVGKYSFGKKLRSSQSLKEQMFLLEHQGSPDYGRMETFISAIQKLVIKDVVIYADREIEATKQVIDKEI